MFRVIKYTSSEYSEAEIFTKQFDFKLTEVTLNKTSLPVSQPNRGYFTRIISPAKICTPTGLISKEIERVSLDLSKVCFAAMRALK